MFGYLAADSGGLTEEQLARYRACYCGLCRSIQQRHGELARLSLTYDMTFLALLLASLYEPEENRGCDTCLPHPRKARDWWQSEATAYAADLNVALAYLKCLDDWHDDGNIAALAESRLFAPGFERVQSAWPRQCEAIRVGLEKLHDLETRRIEDPDAAAGSFGAMMGELFVWREDRWSDTLRRFGDALGRFIYVMDACMDLDADAFHNRYNPFRRYYGLTDNTRRFEDLLRMQLGDALIAFDRLPLVQDVGILQNILCSGLWQQFNKRYKKEDTDGTGPV